MQPRITVMIPTFNCANYLVETLNSIICQDLGPEIMQIEVVDDCSALDDPREVVKTLGDERVGFFCQRHNVGATKNFNTCVERANGDWIHILHGDDYAKPGFYKKMLNTIDKYGADVGLIFCKAEIINEESKTIGYSSSVEDFLKPNNDISSLLYENPIKTPSVLVRKDVYKDIGQFNEKYKHVADWEMWLRAIQKYNGLYIDEALVSYRFFEQNDTNKLIRNGQSMLEHKVFYRDLTTKYPDIDRYKVKKAYKNLILQHYRYMESKNIKYNKKLYIWNGFLAFNILDFYKIFIKKNLESITF
jgi:glycosyltransferase involved in cell wall biosynthesis